MPAWRSPYTVEPQAALRVDAIYHGVPGAPELPCFGVKFRTLCPPWPAPSGPACPADLSRPLQRAVYSLPHEEVPHIAPALVPQDCGLHMDTSRWFLQLADGSELTLEQTGEPFAFSALPNTAQEIEAAQHISRPSQHRPHQHHGAWRSPWCRRYRQLGALM